MKIRTLIGVVGCAALLSMTGVTVTVPAQAQRWEDCRDRIEHAQRRLDRAIDRFGYRSREAHEARRDLEDIRDRCRRHRGHDRWDDRPHRW